MRFLVSSSLVLSLVLSATADITEQECKDQGGRVVAAGYQCQGNGEATDRIATTQTNGVAFAADHEVCCGGTGNGFATSTNNNSGGMFGNTFGAVPEGSTSSASDTPQCVADNDCDPIPCLIPPCPRDICVNGSCVLDDGNLPNPECVRDADCPVINCFVAPCDVNVCNLGICELQAPPAQGVSETAVSSSETTVSSEITGSTSETMVSSETTVSSPETTVSSEPVISSPETPASSSETPESSSETTVSTTASSETVTVISSPETPASSSETPVSSTETTVSTSETTVSSETSGASSAEGLFNGATAQRVDVTRIQCTKEHDGILVADSIDGSVMSIFEKDYLCDSNGLPPIGNIYPRNVVQGKDGNPVASNGEVCCGKPTPEPTTKTPTPGPTMLRTPAPTVNLVDNVEGGEPISITSGAEAQASTVNMASFLAALVTLFVLTFENFVNFFIEDAWVEHGSSDEDEPKLNKDKSETSDSETELSDTEEEDLTETEDEDLLLGDPHTGIREQYKEHAHPKAVNAMAFNKNEAASIRPTRS